MLNATERRFVAIETMISTAANALGPALLIWFFASGAQMALEGRDGFVASLIPPSVGVPPLLTIILTNVIRMRGRKGQVPTPAWTKADHRWLRFVPDNLLLRALLNVVITLGAILPVMILATILLGIDSVGRYGFIFLNLCFGAAIGMVLTPIIVLAAMSERAASEYGPESPSGCS